MTGGGRGWMGARSGGVGGWSGWRLSAIPLGGSVALTRVLLGHGYGGGCGGWLRHLLHLFVGKETRRVKFANSPIICAYGGSERFHEAKSKARGLISLNSIFKHSWN